LTKSTSSFVRKSRNLLAIFCVALAGNLFFLSYARAEDVVPPEVTTIVTPGGDDVSYHIPLTVSVVYDGVTYENVYATTNSVITFGRPDGTYWTYPTTPSVSIESKDWWVLPQQMPDTHFIINVSEGGFQVDGNYRPYGTFTGDTEPAPQPRPIPIFEPPAPEPPAEEPPAPVEEPPAEEPPAEEPPVPVEEPPTPVEEPPAEAEEPPVEAEPAPEEAPEPPVEEEVLQAEDVEASELPADTPIELANGVVLTAGVVAALELFDSPAELLTEVFTNPAQVLTALSNIGADMSEEERQESTETILAAVIVGQIATQSAVAAAASAAAASSTYRRKP
jgi:hypothetical protein